LENLWFPVDFPLNQSIELSLEETFFRFQNGLVAAHGNQKTSWLTDPSGNGRVIGAGIGLSHI